MTKRDQAQGFPDATAKAHLMQRAMATAGISLIFQDADLKILHCENLPVDISSHDAYGGTDKTLFGATSGEKLIDLKRNVLRTGKPGKIDIEIQTATGAKVFEVKAERTQLENAHGILSVITETTDAVHREKVLKSLLRELSHRSKNLLAIIQGIATQTARHTLSLDNFLVKFRGRLQSLSNSQDLITDSSWRGAYLFELAEKQFAPYWPDLAIAMPVFGINAHLNPNASVHVGLALHELIVNSASYGAIASGATSVSLNCSMTELNGKRAIEITWSERVFDEKASQEFIDNSFSKTVLERVVPTSVNGQAKFHAGADRIEYSIVIPSTEFEIIKSA